MSEKEPTTTAVAKLDPYQVMDLLDEQSFIEELKGRVANEWVYSFYQDGQKVVGLSKVGVDACCREMAKAGEIIREEDVTWEIDPTDSNHVLFKGSATRVAISNDGKEYKLDKAIGTKRQCINVVTRQEGVTNRPNNFWFEHGCMKALRNARARLISEDIRAKVIAIAKDQGKIKDVANEKTSTEPVTKTDDEPQQVIEPAPPTVDKAEDKNADKKEIKHLRDKLTYWAEFHIKDKPTQDKLLVAIGTYTTKSGKMNEPNFEKSISLKWLQGMWRNAERVSDHQDALEIAEEGSYERWKERKDEDIPI